MQRCSVVIFVICSYLLSACNIGALQPTLTPSTTPTFIVLDTLTPTLTPSATITPTPTITPTFFYEPTLTPTMQWASCPIIVNAAAEAGSTMLHITRCDDNLQYELGPFSKGVYAVGPNNKFIVYITLNGFIYCARIGDRYPRILADLKKLRLYTTINKNLDPKFVISFLGEDPVYKLLLVEKRYSQRNSFVIPAWMAQ